MKIWLLCKDNSQRSKKQSKKWYWLRWVRIQYLWLPRRENILWKRWRGITNVLSKKKNSNCKSSLKAKLGLRKLTSSLSFSPSRQRNSANRSRKSFRKWQSSMLTASEDLNKSSSLIGTWKNLELGRSSLYWGLEVMKRRKSSWKIGCKSRVGCSRSKSISWINFCWWEMENWRSWWKIIIPCKKA